MILPIDIHYQLPLEERNRITKLFGDYIHAFNQKYLYILFDMRDGIYRYVGQTQSPMVRAENYHRKHAPQQPKLKAWLDSVPSEYLRMRLYCTVHKSEVNTKERQLISALLQEHYPLLNRENKNFSSFITFPIDKAQ